MGEEGGVVIEKLQTSFSNRDINTSAMREPRGDLIEIPMSLGSL